MAAPELPTLFRYQYFAEHGYVVYRHCFDEAKCAVEEGALAHKDAVFVAEDAARLYCTLRNTMLKFHGTDAIPDVKSV